MLHVFLEYFWIDDRLDALDHATIQVFLIKTLAFVALHQFYSSFRTVAVWHVYKTQKLMFVVVVDESEEICQESMDTLN